MLLLGLDDLRVGPVWKSRSELHIAWTFVNLTGLSEIGSDTEARMACSILDLSWRTCARDGVTRRRGQSFAGAATARAASSRPGDGPAAPHLPHRTGGGLLRAAAAPCYCTPQRTVSPKVTSTSWTGPLGCS